MTTVQADIEALQALAGALQQSSAMLHDETEVVARAFTALQHGAWRGRHRQSAEERWGSTNARFRSAIESSAALAQRVRSFAERLEQVASEFGGAQSAATESLAARDQWIAEFLGRGSEGRLLNVDDELTRYYRQETDQLDQAISERQKSLHEAYSEAGLTPPTDTDGYTLGQAVGTVLLNEHNLGVVDQLAQRYQVPPELIAGIVASEMDFDTDRYEPKADGLGRLFNFDPQRGLGLANIHESGMRSGIDYLKAHNLPGAEYAKQYDMSARNRDSVTGTIEGAAIIAAGLVHYKGGVSSTEDMAVVWGGFRSGVQGFSPDARGYGSQEAFQHNIAIGSDGLSEQYRMGGNAYQSQPYFEFFQKAFKLRRAVEEHNQVLISVPRNTA